MSEVSYAYHANALGIGGVIHHPTRKVIPSLAATVLAPTGGLGSSVVTEYDQDGVSFTTAYSMVRGDIDSNGDFRTDAEVTIDNLDIRDTLHVDRMRATVTSLRNVNEDEANITFHAEYSGVFVGAYEIVPHLDLDLFTVCPTFDTFLAYVARDRATYADRFNWNEGDSRKVAQAIDAAFEPIDHPTGPNTLHAVQASMLRDVDMNAGIEKRGHVLKVPGVGKVRLAEVLLKPGRRRLTLLQLDLDQTAPVIRRMFEKTSRMESGARTAGIEITAPTTPSGGNMTMASLEGNGTLIWPKQGG